MTKVRHVLPAKGRRREDYLKHIYAIQKSKGYARVKDLSRALNVSSASVIEFARKLESDGLIRYDGGVIVLTEKGKAMAEKIYERFLCLKDFFQVILGLPEREAIENACYLEHGLTEKAIERMCEMVNKYKEKKINY
ncbi:MAG: metal-dependent transcriptional regulator [Desulfurococcales archaeon]|nr:metal-dependent transcriptional regulator [Desulfurococcales archaeon]